MRLGTPTRVRAAASARESELVVEREHVQERRFGRQRRKDSGRPLAAVTRTRTGSRDLLELETALLDAAAGEESGGRGGEPVKCCEEKSAANREGVSVRRPARRSPGAPDVT
jgi:hypothetical protein